MNSSAEDYSDQNRFIQNQLAEWFQERFCVFCILGTNLICQRLGNRAKIFAPFAALVGFDERVHRKEIIYVAKHELDADEEWVRVHIVSAKKDTEKLIRLHSIARISVK